MGWSRCSSYAVSGVAGATATLLRVLAAFEQAPLSARRVITLSRDLRAVGGMYLVPSPTPKLRTLPPLTRKEYLRQKGKSIVAPEQPLPQPHRELLGDGYG